MRSFLGMVLKLQCLNLYTSKSLYRQQLCSALGVVFTDTAWGQHLVERADTGRILVDGLDCQRQ